MARSTDEMGAIEVPSGDDLAVDLRELATATVAERTEPAHEPLLRAVAAEIQSDESLAAPYREHLLCPQLDAISQRFRLAGVFDAEGAAEASVGPIFHAWFLRVHPLDAPWVEAHVARVVRGAQPRVAAGLS